MIATIPVDLLERLDVVNRIRRAFSSDAHLEAQFDTAYQADFQLAVYGSLAPGRVNHHRLEALGNHWRSDVFTFGDLVQTGWGADLGFPAIRWNPRGERVAVQLLRSAQLPAAWEELDAFEGAEYVRILVPIFSGTQLITIANLYEAAS
jgi:gamma-glutamylcyclotransferase (GGCT)/AIG2-like uncharacterized protein YtfP